MSKRLLLVAIALVVVGSILLYLVAAAKKRVGLANSLNFLEAIHQVSGSAAPPPSLEQVKVSWGIPDTVQVLYGCVKDSTDIHNFLTQRSDDFVGKPKLVIQETVEGAEFFDYKVFSPSYRVLKCSFFDYDIRALRESTWDSYSKQGEEVRLGVFPQKDNTEAFERLVPYLFDRCGLSDPYCCAATTSQDGSGCRIIKLQTSEDARFITRAVSRFTRFDTCNLDDIDPGFSIGPRTPCHSGKFINLLDRYIFKLHKETGVVTVQEIRDTFNMAN